QRRQRGRAQHPGAAGRKRRRELARRQQQREVPGHDRERRPHRAVHDQEAAAPVRALADAPAHPQRLVGVPAQVLGGSHNLGARLGERLPGLQRQEQRQPLAVRLDGGGGPAQDRGAGGGRRGGPGGLGGGRSAKRGEGIGL